MEDLKGKTTRTVNEIRATASVASLPSAAESEDNPICWICLDGASSERILHKPCKCPRYCHSTCIARWQLQSAGSRKETHCEFCQETLPDWKPILTPPCGADAPAVMNVNFDGRTYSFEVTPGIDGYKLFTDAIRNAFNLPEDSELNITFTCDEPSTGQSQVITPAGALLTLQGSGAYDAAVHCASVSAARRLTTQSSSSSQDAGTRSGSNDQRPGSRDVQIADRTATGEQQVLSAMHHSSKPRRMAALGRKLRTAIADLLTMK